jgi:hypothetical protein
MLDAKKLDIKFLLSLKTEIEKYGDGYIKKLTTEKKDQEEKIKQKCTADFSLVTGKLAALKDLEHGNIELMRKKSDFQESIAQYIRSNMYALDATKGSESLVKNYESTELLVKSIKSLFGIMRKIEDFRKVGNFLTAKNLLNFITDTKFEKAFKVQRVSEIFRSYKKSILQKIRENIDELLRKFLDYTLKDEQKSTNIFKSLCNKYLKASDQEDYLKAIKSRISSDAMHHALKPDIPSPSQSPPQPSRTPPLKAPPNPSQTLQIEETAMSRFISSKMSTSTLGLPPPDHPKKSTNSSALNTSNIYVPSTQAPLYQLKADFGLLDSCIELCEGSASETNSILESLKHQRRTKFIDELSYMGKDVNAVKSTIGYILSFLLNERALEQKLSRYVFFLGDFGEAGLSHHPI